MSVGAAPASSCWMGDEWVESICMPCTCNLWREKWSYKCTAAGRQSIVTPADATNTALSVFPADRIPQEIPASSTAFATCVCLRAWFTVCAWGRCLPLYCFRPLFGLTKLTKPHAPSPSVLGLTSLLCTVPVLNPVPVSRFVFFCLVCAADNVNCVSNTTVM